jgi:hypothetical protein
VQTTKNTVSALLLIYYLVAQYSSILFNILDVPQTRSNVTIFLIAYRLIVPICLSWAVIAYGDSFTDIDQLKKEWIFSIIFRFTQIHRLRRFVIADSSSLDKMASKRVSILDRLLLCSFRLVRSNYYFHPIFLVCITCRMQAPLDTNLYALVSNFLSFY